ncbi:sugar phosphate isomerase/epimerase family protein [Gryllotalpicola ginsengisoli]|uniref:sugar phosphate isomerase/epimerase family protein n=1 Tax=Gryllotalpicola ginsengisoli TaxID=444608 RepID=UPI0003B459A2|nr:sugar phosphate isomerase/epimerase [Gryllotalpicola ginsengisoli]
MTESLLSVQLYTVREALQDDLAGTLARLAELGFTQVEPFNIMGLDSLEDGLAAAGLASPTAHQRFVGEDLGPIFDRAAALGVQTLIDPHIDESRWRTAGEIARIADDLAAAAEAASAVGLKVGYHNHAFEFETKVDGSTAYDIFVERLPENVFLELDTYWAAVGGSDPVALLKELGDRVVALHVKDGPATHENKDQVAVGRGRLPIRAIIDAAPNALRVIELDDSRGDRFTAVADSVAFLKQEGLA